MMLVVLKRSSANSAKYRAFVSYFVISDNLAKYDE